MEHKYSGKWLNKSTPKVYENTFFSVSEDDVIKPTGEDGKYATIRFNSGASVLPILILKAAALKEKMAAGPSEPTASPANRRSELEAFTK